MNYPLISEYIEAIKSPEENFEKLRHLRPVLDADGNPFMSSGNFAVVFKMTDGKKDYAIKCFTREQEGRENAYSQISSFLEKRHESFLVNLHYLKRELFVDTKNSTNTEYPVVQMDWVDGIMLENYISSIFDIGQKREELFTSFRKFVLEIISSPFAHGDIKPENIIITPEGEIKLVDYDGMFVPQMQGNMSREVGSPFYSHPNRSMDCFDRHIDDYSLILLLLIIGVNSKSPLSIDTLDRTIGLRFISQFDQKVLEEKEISTLVSAYLYVSSHGVLAPSLIPALINNTNDFDYVTEDRLLEDIEDNCCTKTMNKLGDLYSKHDVSKSIFWYALAYKCGDVNACCSLCRNLWRVVPKSVFELMAKKGVGMAYCRLGEEICPVTVYGDEMKSYEYFSKGSAVNHAQCLYWLASFSWEELKKTDKLSMDVFDPITLYTQSAELGYISAQTRLAEAYFKGEIKGKKIDKNIGLSFRWYLAAAKQGDVKSIYEVGRFYENGWYVSFDMDKAIFWYKKASELGYYNADIHLANIHWNGMGVAKDVSTAISFYEKAINNNEFESENIQYIVLLMKFYYNKKAIDHYNKKLLYYVSLFEKYIKYAKTEIRDEFETPFIIIFVQQYLDENLECLVEIGNIYYEGIGVKQNINEAIYFWTRAANKGFSDADYLLEKTCKLNNIYDVTYVHDYELPNIPGVANSGIYSADQKRFLCYWGTYGEKYVVKEGTQVLCDDSFNDLYSECDGHYLEILYLPKSLKRIGNNVFCASITKIVCDSPNFIVDKDFLFSHDKKILYRYFGRNDKVVIPDGVKYIKGGAFSDRDDIKEVTIPESVIAVGDNPFASWGMSKTKVISYSKNICVEQNLLYDEKEKCLIANLSNQKVVFVKNGTKIIGKDAFHWSELESLHLPESITSIHETAFYGSCIYLKKIRVYSHVYNLLPTYLKKNKEICFDIVDDEVLPL